MSIVRPTTPTSPLLLFRLFKGDSNSYPESPFFPQFVILLHTFQDTVSFIREMVLSTSLSPDFPWKDLTGLFLSEFDCRVVFNLLNQVTFLLRLSSPCLVIRSTLFPYVLPYLWSLVWCKRLHFLWLIPNWDLDQDSDIVGSKKLYEWPDSELHKEPEIKGRKEER